MPEATSRAIDPSEAGAQLCRSSLAVPSPGTAQLLSPTPKCGRQRGAGGGAGKPVGSGDAEEDSRGQHTLLGGG